MPTAPPETTQSKLKQRTGKQTSTANNNKAEQERSETTTQRSTTKHRKATSCKPSRSKSTQSKARQKRKYAQRKLVRTLLRSLVGLFACLCFCVSWPTLCSKPASIPLEVASSFVVDSLFVGVPKPQGGYPKANRGPSQGFSSPHSRFGVQQITCVCEFTQTLFEHFPGIPVLAHIVCSTSCNEVVAKNIKIKNVFSKLMRSRHVDAGKDSD